MNIYMIFLIINLSLPILYIIYKTSIIEIKIEKFNFNSNKIKDKKINDDFKIIITLKTLKKLPLLKIKLNKLKIKKITKEILENKKVRKTIKNIQEDIIKNKGNVDKLIIKEFNYINHLYKKNKLKINFENMDLKMLIGSKDMFFTILLVPIVSSIFGIIIAKEINNTVKNKCRYKYIINPSFEEKNQLIINLDLVLKIRVKEIIKMIKYTKKYNKEILKKLDK